MNDFKHRIRMFGCIYQIMKDEELFYIKDKQLKDSSVKADYIKYALIDNKGANVRIRYFENQYIAYTMLIDRSINPTATDACKCIDIDPDTLYELPYCKEKIA